MSCFTILTALIDHIRLLHVFKIKVEVEVSYIVAIPEQ